MPTQFAMYPIQRIAQGMNYGGPDDYHFDPSILPITTVEGATIEDVSALFAEDEFDYLKGHLTDDSINLLRRIKYAIVHRADDFEDNGNGRYTLARDLLIRSQNIVAEIAACLRLIRPTAQRTQMLSGGIRREGGFSIRVFNDPISSVELPANQLHFTVSTEDIQELIFYAPLFRAAMQGENWKFRMAVSMHELGHFQNYDWKARYFLWSSALEGLFTSKPRTNWQEHSGARVASERIKDLLGATTSIYPPRELISLQSDPGITVGDVIGDVYCLRNHIAHGDKVPDYYYQLTDRFGPMGQLKRVEMLLEAISFVIRNSLLKILKDNLVSHFQDGPSSEAYFTGKRLTKSLLHTSLRTYICKG
jgi:hypothetical protein